MLPLYASSAEQEKMNRHGYSGGGTSPESPQTFFNPGRRVATMGESGRGIGIRTDKYDKYHPSSSRTLWHRRKQSLMRLGGLLTAVLLILMIIFPSLRPAAIFSSLSLAFLSPGEEFNIETVRYYDLSNVGGTSRGWEREERILLCAPLRDAAPHLPMFFSHLKNLTYPHNLIDLAFLVGDSKDNTALLLSELLGELQSAKNPKNAFGEISVIEKDFGQVVNQDVESRHGFAAQAGRRKSMAQARNWLLSAALRPTHSWVYWRDVDVETAPFTILEDLMRHNKDVIVPNVWRPLPEWLGGEQPYDLNSWQESETALALADTLDEDAVIVEGYAEYATWRPHLAYLRDPYGDPDMEMEIDGVGGVSILAKAKVFRSGVHFPAFSFEKHAETEGFGKMAKRMSYSVVGLPHYTIWHLYEPSFEDIRHMEELEAERAAAEESERQKRQRKEKIEQEFDVGAMQQYEKDKQAMREAVRKMKEVRGRSHPEEAENERRMEVAKERAVEEATKQRQRQAAGAGDVKIEPDTEGKMHIEDPLGEIKQLGGDKDVSENARAAAVKQEAAQAKQEVANEKVAAAMDAALVVEAARNDKVVPEQVVEAKVPAQGAGAAGAGPPVAQERPAQAVHV